MFWQIGNEFCLFGEDNKKSFVVWIVDCVVFIKFMDFNYLVFIGLEGMVGCEGDLLFWIFIYVDVNVDYIMIYIWLNNWGWIDKKDILGIIGQVIENICFYIDMYVQEVFKINKLLVFEEFGLLRDSVKFILNIFIVQWDWYYRVVFDIVEKYVVEKGVF